MVLCQETESSIAVYKHKVPNPSATTTRELKYKRFPVVLATNISGTKDTMSIGMILVMMFLCHPKELSLRRTWYF